MKRAINEATLMTNEFTQESTMQTQELSNVMMVNMARQCLTPDGIEQNDLNFVLHSAQEGQAEAKVLVMKLLAQNIINNVSSFYGKVDNIPALVEEGNIGVLSAIDKSTFMNMTEWSKFESFAKRTIRLAMCSYMEQEKNIIN
ncbi:hypothetical protein N9R79_12060 [Vibrio sp.]|nr:hypothetical protein [Vibrio sp.]